MTNAADDTNKLLLVIIAILLPPLAIGLKRGIGLHLMLNIVLLLLTFGVGAIIHALIVVLRG
ncbi:MAG: YqaE/Pmp3 family membrane protein [Planctomycetota bacterium]